MSYTGHSFSSQPFVKGYYILSFVSSLDDDTDFRIKLGPYIWRVHSQLISQESEFFRKIASPPPYSSTTTSDPNDEPLDGRSQWKESDMRLAEIHDDEPWMIARMLQYFYYKQYDYEHTGSTGTMKQPGGSNKRPDPAMMALASSSVTLEKLMSVGKRGDSSYEEIKGIDGKYSNPEIDLHMFVVADKYGAMNLKSKILANFIGQGKIVAAELLRMCDETMRGLISRDVELKRAVAGKVARCYRDTVVANAGQGGQGGAMQGWGGQLTTGGSGSGSISGPAGGSAGSGGGIRERPLDEWLLADPQICLLAMEQMNAPNF